LLKNGFNDLIIKKIQLQLSSLLKLLLNSHYLLGSISLSFIIIIYLTLFYFMINE